MVRRCWQSVCLLIGLAGCASTPPPVPAPPVAAAPHPLQHPPRQPGLAPLSPPAAQTKQSPPAPELRLVGYEAQVGLPSAAAPESLSAPGLQPASIRPVTPTFPIDLPTAWRLADADNLQVALAREQVQLAYAEYRQAGALWLPSLRGGVHWNHHDGSLLSSQGILRDLSRSSLYSGFGATAVGGGSPQVPGIFASFNIADAIFRPLAAQQRWGAGEQGANAARNNALLDVTLAYLELLRAAQDQAIAQDVHDKVREIWQLTESFVKTGQSPQADADRMRVEVGLREIDIRRAREAQAVASARLAQLLRLEPCILLEPLEPTVVEICLVDKDAECCDLVAQALLNRPELVQNRYLVGEAVQRLRRERFGPLVPSVILGASYGGFGGGLGSTVDPFKDRFDFDATAFWELRNLGFGEAAARQGAGSRLRQAQIQELQVLDQVAREVTEAYAQLQIRTQQIQTAKDVVRFAGESYDHNLVRIRAGQGLPIEVLQSTQALLQARREFLRAIIDYNVAQFSLQRALGWPVGQPSLTGPAEPLAPVPPQ